MPPLSALKELGKTEAPSLKTSFSTYLLDWGKISHLIPDDSTQNLVYLYDREKQPALVQKEILLSNLSSRELPSDAITFPPHDIHTSGLSETPSNSRMKPDCGDIFLWKTESGNVLGCWVLQPVNHPISSAKVSLPKGMTGKARRPRVKTWIRVNIRRPNMRHPLDNNLQLEVDTDGSIGWLPVQIFAANSLVKDLPPPPDFENLGKIYWQKFGLVYLFLIRHEDSDEQNLCYLHIGAPSTFQINLKDPYVMTKPGDIFIDIPGQYADLYTKLTPTSLLRRQLWVRSKAHIWSEIKRVNGEYQSRHVRHPIHPDYVLEPPTLRSPYPQWVFEPRDSVSDTHLPSHDIHTKGAPTTDPSPRSKGAMPPKSSDPVCGQKRSAPETPETIESEQSNGYATGSGLPMSRRVKKIDSLAKKVDDAKKRKLVVRSVPTVTASPPAPEGSSKISQSANYFTISPEAHDDLKRRLEKTRKKYILQKNMAGGLRTSLLEAQDSLQKHRTEAQQADVGRLAEISALEEKLRDRSQEVQRLSDEVQSTKAHVHSTEKALKGQKNACSLVTSRLEQLQNSSNNDQRQLALLRELRSDAEAKLDATNGELLEIRDAVDRLRKENEVEHRALADAVNGRAVAESRVQEMEAAMKDLLQKKEEHEKIAQHLEIELQRTKDEMERSVDTATKATSQVTALEEICAEHKRNASTVDGELSSAREEISRLRSDVKRSADLEIELQRTKDELERSVDKAEKAASQVAALEERCAKRKRNYSAVEGELSRAREEISQLRCDVRRNDNLEIELQQKKDELERSVDTAKKAKTQAAALEEVCANHSAVDEELKRAREEISQLRCDIKRNTNLESELQRTKEEMERSVDIAKKAKIQAAALEEVCANHSAVDEELARAREEVSQLRCDVKHNANLEIELQRTKDEMERLADTAKKATSQVASLEEICAKHKQNASVVDEELTRAREENSQLIKHNDGLKMELQRTKDEIEHSVDIAKKATGLRVAALEEACANHKRDYSAVDEELSRARGEISQLRCDIERNANLESELQRTKEEMELSVDTAKKAKSQAAALEEVCANHKLVDEELARAREEISQLRCDVKHNANLEIELQRTKDEMERSAKQTTSQVAALEEICANHERNSCAVDEELSRAREETSELRCNIKTREEVIARETRAREDSDAALSSTKRFLEQERSGFTTALSGIQDELRAEKMRRRSSEEELEAIRRECRTPFKVPILMDLFLEMDRRAKGESLL